MYTKLAIKSAYPLTFSHKMSTSSESFTCHNTPSHLPTHPHTQHTLTHNTPSHTAHLPTHPHMTFSHNEWVLPGRRYWYISSFNVTYKHVFRLDKKNTIIKVCTAFLQYTNKNNHNSITQKTHLYSLFLYSRGCDIYLLSAGKK